MSLLSRLFPPPTPIKKIQRKTSAVHKKVQPKIASRRRDSTMVMFQTLKQHPNVTAPQLQKLLGYDNIQSIYTLISYNKGKIVKTRNGSVVMYRVKFARAPKAAATPVAVGPKKQSKAPVKKSPAKAKRLRGWADPVVQHSAVMARWPNHVCTEKCPTYQAPEMTEAEMLSSKIPEVGTMLTTVAKPSVFNVKQACQTSNISLAAGLYARNHKLLDTKTGQGGNGVFIFEQSPQFIFEAQQFWNRNLPVDARTYHESLRTLRAKLANL